MPFLSFEAFHNSFPISFLSKTKKTSPILHENGRREFHLEIDLTWLFTVAIPLPGICPEGFPALYLPGTTFVASYTYNNLPSMLGKRKRILDNGNMLSLDKKSRLEHSYTVRCWSRFECSLNTEFRKPPREHARRHRGRSWRKFCMCQASLI